jgi:hypothetical protein
MPARVTLAFVELGAMVSVIVPQGSPVLKVRNLLAAFGYSPFDPLTVLSRTILKVKPDLIIPCDDRVVEHLHRIFDKRNESSEFKSCALIIERSLGEPAGFALTTKRTPLLQLAARKQILTPQTDSVYNLSALRGWLDRYGYPAVLKVDGTWAGTGVRVVRSWEQAQQAFLDLTRPPSLMTRLRFLCAHDLFPLFAQDDHKRLQVTVQAFIQGRSVNAMYACWQGVVVDHLSVEALYAVDRLGSSTIIKTIANPEMEQAGRLIVQELGMSGFCGLDFIVEANTGKLYLIELNPRATQIGHLTLIGKQNLVAALYGALRGEPSMPSTTFVEETIAFFPHSLRCDPNHPMLSSPTLRHDIPIEEPELVRELSRKPWNSRHLSSKVYSVLRKVLTRERLEKATQADPLL